MTFSLLCNHYVSSRSQIFCQRKNFICFCQFQINLIYLVRDFFIIKINFIISPCRKSRFFHKFKRSLPERFCHFCKTHIFTMTTHNNSFFTGLCHSFKHNRTFRNIPSVFCNHRNKFFIDIIKMTCIFTIKIFCDTNSLEKMRKTQSSRFTLDFHSSIKRRNHRICIWHSNNSSITTRSCRMKSCI